MKAALTLLALVASIGFSHAGGFGGPPPFTNGSPLITGIDGSYSGNISAENTVGVVRFTFANGVQTSTSADNSYAIFSEGLVFTGENQVSISDGSIAGVMDRDTTPAFENTAMTGFFNADLDLNSSMGYFNGTGLAQFFIEEPADSDTFVNLFSKEFKIKGTRNSTTGTSTES